MSQQQLIVPPAYMEFRRKELMAETADRACMIARALEQRTGRDHFKITVQKDRVARSPNGKATFWWCVWHQPPGCAAQLAARVEFVKGQDPDLDAIADQLRRSDKSRHGSDGAMANMLDWANEPREEARRDEAREVGGEMGERSYHALGEWLDEHGTGRLTPELRRKVAGVKRRKVLP